MLSKPCKKITLFLDDREILFEEIPNALEQSIELKELYTEFSTLEEISNSKGLGIELRKSGERIEIIPVTIYRDSQLLFNRNNSSDFESLSVGVPISFRETPIETKEELESPSKSDSILTHEILNKEILQRPREILNKEIFTSAALLGGFITVGAIVGGPVGLLLSAKIAIGSMIGLGTGLGIGGTIGLGTGLGLNIFRSNKIGQTHSME